MIRKSIIATLLVVSLVNANNEIENSHTDNTKLNVWNPTITNIKSGKSCDDGNCLKDLNCFQKDGKAYTLFTSLRDKVKKKLRKL